MDMRIPSSTVPCCLVPLLFVSAASAQLVPPGAAIPRGANPPVVFLNGYQGPCSGVTFAGTFGAADQVLQASGIASVFFDNCAASNRGSIEQLGASFARFLAGLKF